jgi:hypothetical protein
MKNNRRNPAGQEHPSGARIYYIRRQGVGERSAQELVRSLITVHCP